MVQSREAGDVEQLLTDMQQNGVERAAFFFDVSNHFFGFGIVDFATGENGFFFGDYGEGDFLRMNPDGTFTTHLVTTEADAFTIDFASGGIYSGTGLMNYRMSGTFVVYDSNGGPVFLLAEPSLNAEVVQGLAAVTLNGSGADPHRLHMNFVSNPGGQGHFRLTFNPLEEDED